jgi:glycosyltransferase involved in cell wall biosynthesis
MEAQFATSDLATAAPPAHPRLRVLIVPDWIDWVLGTVAKATARYNPWFDATIISGSVLESAVKLDPRLFDRFDLVHFVCPYASRIWMPRLRQRMACVTSHHHTSEWELQKHNLDGDAIVVGSRQWRDDLLQRGAIGERIACIPYGVDAERFVVPTAQERAARRRALGFRDTTTVVGFFAKRSSDELGRKGTDIFVEAILELRRSVPDLAALIIGPGWHDLVATLKAADIQCVWIPFVRELDGVRPMYHVLDFYWVTARVEGGPVTLLEAMSSGVACVTTPVGLAREIVTDGDNAAMVPIGDASGVVKRTLDLIGGRSERQRMILAARQTILRTMHVAVTMRRVENAYRIALDEFARRTGQTPRVTPSDVAMAAGHSEGRRRDDVPLDGIPAPEMRKQLALLEQLAWAEALINQRQRSLAFRTLIREWARHPTSPLPLRQLLRHFLPQPVTSSLARVRASLARRGYVS